MDSPRSVGWAFVFAALVLLGSLGALSPLVGEGPDTPAETEASFVRIHAAGSQIASLDGEADIVETYDTFVLARATDRAIERLEAQGITVVPEDLFSLHINGYRFDTRQEVRVPAEVAARAEIGGHHIVQFIGPIKDEWRWRLEARGVDVVGYVPNNAYVVRGSAQELAALSGLHEIQWLGPFHPAYKIAPELLAAGGPLTVKITTFPGERPTTIVTTLAKIGLPVLDRRSNGEGILAWQSFEDIGFVRARLDPDLMIPLSHLDAVRYIEPDVEPVPANQHAQFVLQTNATDGTVPGARRIWDMGLRGQGEIIAIADTGLDYDHSMLRHSSGQVTIGDVYNVTDLNRRKVVRYLPMSSFVGIDPFTGGDPQAIKDSPGAGTNCASGGTGHGTSVGGSAAGRDDGIGASANDGTAPEAKLIVLDIGTVGLVENVCDDVLAFLPDDYGDMFATAYDEGARIFSNSWGSTESAYTLGASRVDRFVWERPDALILFANGNAVTSAFVTSPATAKNVVSIGGAARWDLRENMGASSRGPTPDGRRKPDITTIFQTISPGGTARSDGNLASSNSGETAFAGTSYAAPLAAGMAALARQYFREGWYPTGAPGGVPMTPSAALLKATLAAGSVQMVGTGACQNGLYPNNDQGWGRLWLDEALYFAGDQRKLFVVDHDGGLGTGDTLEYTVRLTSPAGRLRAFLAWTDPPAMERASPALVNNLDLEVLDPSGTSYRGGVAGTCATGQTPSGGSFDTRNNLEGVVRLQPPTGDWRIRVIGANVPMGPQRFALVVLADLDRAFGVVETDRTVYSESDTITVTFTGGNAVAPARVGVSSTTEPAGEIITLANVGPSLWRGTLPTDYSVPAADGRLQVSQGDVVTVQYGDRSPSHVSIARARAEIDGPAIADVRATAITNDAVTIRWTTDKPGNSTVFYGTTTALGSVVGDAVEPTNHVVTLTRLATGTLYYFDVASTRAGHAIRDGNGGAHYTFRTTGAGDILLVVADDSFTVDRVAMYRDALASSGWTWNEWHIALRGDPSLSTLRQYKAVLWQSGLEQYPPMSDTHVPLLSAYVNGGGRFLVGGHDHAWAACSTDSAFRSGSRCNFVKSILKADFRNDPQTWTRQIGVSGDPISGAYAGGVSYLPHRDGGAGDEVGRFDAGGTSAFVWMTDTLAGDPDAIRWESSAVNGTATTGCAWCGTRSRVVSYIFEFTGINYGSGQPNNAARTDILNRTIRWLVGERDRVVVELASPNGGETFTGTTLAVSWSRSSPVPIASQELWSSRDAGQTWTFVKSVAAGSTSDTIDISDLAAWPNDDRYRIRVVVRDSDTPSFVAQDDSNANFRIVRSGGDSGGPLARPGSLRVSPNAAQEGTTLTIDATVDDALRGASLIGETEFFVQATEPVPAAYGTGTAMTPVDGTLDSATESVRGTVATTWPVGSTQTVWVHGRDSATPTANWGPFAILTFLVIPVPPVPPPGPPLDVTASLLGDSFETVRISWTISLGPPIDRFEVYMSTTYDVGRAGYTLLTGAGNLPPTQTTFDHVNAGHGDPGTYFYFVRAVNVGGGSDSIEQAAKFTRSLANVEWNLVSIPVHPPNPSVAAALQTLNWTTARTYVASDMADPWKAWSTATGRGDLASVSAGMALWVHLAAPGAFTIAGQVPATTTINLVAGWNFVGYASFTPRVASDAFVGLSVTQLESYAASPPYYLQRLALSTTLETGRGYWVYTTTGGVWTVTN